MPEDNKNSNFDKETSQLQYAHDRALNDKLMELQALFEMSQILNSSLNLKSILDNMLLTSMGKMMISKGIILLQQQNDIFVVENLKGLDRSIIGKKVQIDAFFNSPIFTKEMSNNWVQFFQKLGIMVLFPVSSNNKNLGIVGFGGKIANIEYSQAELDFLNSLSNIAATAIERGLIFQELNDVYRRLDRKYQELNTLFEISKELNSAALDSNNILNLLVYAIMGEMVVNRCAILLKREDRMELRLSKGMGNIDEDINERLTDNLQQKLCSLVAPISISNPDASEYFQSLLEINFQVLVPMRIQDENQGIIMVGPKIVKQEFRSDELEFLFTLGNQAMISLENARLFEEMREKERMEEELNIAREIQQRLLPKNLPEFENFDIAAINVSSYQIGGDYFDCIKIDDTHYGIAIADVSGKGVPASLLMSNVQASLHSLIETDLKCPEMIKRMNNLIYKNTTPDKFVTFFYGVLNVENSTFTFCNAGHNPPYLYHKNDEYHLLEKGGLLLGMFPDMTYQTETIKLNSGDCLFLYTDGVSEAMNIKDEEFGTDRIEFILKKFKEKTAQELLNTYLTAIRAYAENVPQSDDITMVILKVK
ncbi:SpoIIE family protein phosphatase [candidate division KSB1 bacterium]|nr:SpoIIE family protein phosphatase [candidate division KSB1 bacterium]